jgi:hypothetical protein
LQNRVSSTIAFRDFILKRGAQGGIGLRFFPAEEDVVIDEKFRLQDAESLELSEKIGGRLRRGAHRIFRVHELELIQSMVSLGKLQVVHLTKTQIEETRGRQSA